MASLLLKSLKVGSSKEELKTKKFAVETVLTKPFTTVNAYIDFWEHMDSTNASNFVALIRSPTLRPNTAPLHGLHPGRVADRRRGCGRGARGVAARSASGIRGSALC